MSINLAVFASGSGTTLQVIIDSIENKKLDAKISVVVSNKPDAYALQRAQKAGIPTYVISSKGKENIDNELFECLKNYEIDLIVLAGYLRMIGDKLLANYRIINTHPSLLPKFGGKGMHGMNVHQAVIDSKEKISGVTVHFVNNEYDRGNIIRQVEVEVLPDDDAETLSARVQVAEKIQLVQVLQDFSEGKI
ncbi:MAG: phosphoribosylglycinamide formyltransferase [Clostridia bacterium]|nr:phosphoribosylglycinamide formyltransferase [Clostridia bacterium]